MNIIDVQDQLKNFSEQQLISEMQMPTGSAPQFLVLSEIKRRKRVRDDFMKREAANQPTVAEEAIAAAGVPQSGIMGMSEAMAPQAAVAEGGIGSIMPQSMRPQAMPAPTDDAIPMAEGGIIHAQKGTYFPSTQELYGIYGQESGFGKNLFGSSGEIGPYQILPTTAIMPGFGITSMFPELEAAVARGDYENAQEAYLANKDAVDEALMSGQRSEGFVQSYLDAAESELGDRNKALLSFNQGIPGTRNFEGDATGTDYVSGVLGNQSGYSDPDREVIPGVTAADLAQQDQEPGLFSAQGATLNQSEDQEVDDGNFFDFLFKTREDRLAEEKANDPEAFAIKEEQAIIKRAEEMAKLPPSVRRSEMNKLYETNPELAMKVDELIPAATQGGGMEFEVFPEEGDPSVTMESAQQQADEAEISNQAGSVKRLEADSRTFDPQTAFDVEAMSQRDFSPPVVTDTQTPTDSETDTGGKDEPKDDPKDDPLPAGPTGLAKEIADLQAKLDKDKETDKYLALAQAGLALMSSKEPTLLGAIGEAGVSGLTAFREAQDRYQEGVVDLINARAKLQKTSDTNVLSRDVLLRESVSLFEAAQKPDVLPEDKDALMARAAQLRALAGIPDFSVVN